MFRPITRITVFHRLERLRAELRRTAACVIWLYL